MTLFPNDFTFWDIVVRTLICLGSKKDIIQPIIAGKIGRSSNDLNTCHFSSSCAWGPLAKPHSLSQHSTYLSLTNGFQLPVSFWNYSKETITFCHRNQRSLHPLATIKHISYSPPFNHLVPKRSTCVTLQAVQYPPAPGCKLMSIINCSQFHLSSVWCPVDH